MTIRIRRLPSLAIALLLLTGSSQLAAVPINFSGPLVDIEIDLGGAIYSGVPTGTTFTGVIDDVTASGNVSDGLTPTVFGCCIAAGALEFTDDVVIDAAFAAQGNLLAGASIFNDGDVIDLIDLEGDVMTASGGRIEVGLSFVLDPAAFDSAIYPFDPANLLLAVFFILEEDSSGTDIYSGIGPLKSVTLRPFSSSGSAAPLPGTAWLLCFGLLAAIPTWYRRRG